jgi:hypothetical protein
MEKIKILVYNLKIIELNVYMLSIKQKWRQGIGYELDGKGLLFTYFFGTTECPLLNCNLIMLICLNLSRPLGE